jgi:hypothetical protein
MSSLRPSIVLLKIKPISVSCCAIYFLLCWTSSIFSTIEYLIEIDIFGVITYDNATLLHLVTLSLGVAGAYAESSHAIAAQRVSDAGGNDCLLRLKKDSKCEFFY